MCHSHYLFCTFARMKSTWLILLSSVTESDFGSNLACFYRESPLTFTSKTWLLSQDSLYLTKSATVMLEFWENCPELSLRFLTWWDIFVLGDPNSYGQNNGLLSFWCKQMNLFLENFDICPIYKTNLVRSRSLSDHGPDQIWLCKWYLNSVPAHVQGPRSGIKSGHENAPCSSDQTRMFDIWWEKSE